MRRGGVVANDPTALEALAKTPGGLAELQQRLLAENGLALEDGSAPARVRAFDWLQSRGAAPAGFDPLAPLPERRAALAAAEAAAERGHE